MGLVHGQNVLLRISNGGALNAVACNANCSLDLSTDTYETTFEDTGVTRSFIPNKHTCTLKGNGPIVLGQDVRASDIMLYQLNKVIITWEFSYNDGTDSATYSGSGFFTNITIDGPVGGAATCDYTIQVSGEISITAAPPTGEGDEYPFEYEATGGELSWSDTDLIGAVILIILREGIGMPIITTGTPVGNEIKFESLTGTFTVASTATLGAGEYLNGIYQL